MKKYILLTAALLAGLASVASGQYCPPGSSCSSGQCPPSYSQPQWQVDRPQAAAPVAQQIPEAVRKAQAGIVMISNRGEGGGSGTYIGDGLVLTCDHLFRDERGQISYGRIVCSFPNGTASEATLIQQSYEWDVALLRLKSPPEGAYAVPLSPTHPVRAQTVYAAGYGQNGVIAAFVGRVTGFGLNKRRQPGMSDMMIAAGAVRFGDSGGPVFDRYGRLVAIVWGGNNRTFVGCQVNRVRFLYRGWLGRILCPPARPPVVVVPPVVQPVVPPVVQPVVPPVVQPPPVPNVSCTVCLEQVATLRDEIAVLRRQLGEVALLEPVPGPPGPQGPAGLNGLDAPPVDVEAIVSRIKSELRYPASFSVVPN